MMYELLTPDELTRALDYPYSVPSTHFIFDAATGETALRPRLELVAFRAVGEHDGATFYDIDIVENGVIETLKSVCPVVASGSNASPAQLARKYSGKTRHAIVSMHCEFRGFIPVYSAHFARYGAIAATLLEYPDAISGLVMSFLPEAELALMHATESIGVQYDFKRMPRGALVQPGFEDMQICYYASRHPALLTRSEDPILVSSFEVRDCLLRHANEREILNLAFAQLYPGRDFKEALTEIVRSSEVRAGAEIDLRTIRIDFDGLFYVRPTKDRSSSKGRYLVRMSKAAAHRSFGSRLPRIVVVSYSHPKLEYAEISVMGWLVPELEENALDRPSDRKLSLDQVIQVDQTLRQALGFDYYGYSRESVKIAQLKGVGIVHEFFSRLIGRRLVYCRTGILQHRDIEKGIVRVSDEVLGMVGTNSGERVIMAGIKKCGPNDYRMKIWRAAALTASDEYQERYAELNEEDRKKRLEKGPLPVPDMSARTPDIAALIGQTDINVVYVDYDARANLLGDDEAQNQRCQLNTDDPLHQRNLRDSLYPRTVQCAQPLLLYRAPSGAIANEIMAIGIAVAALELNFILAAKELFGPELWSKWSFLLAVGGLPLSILLACIVAFWKTRAAVK